METSANNRDKIPEIIEEDTVNMDANTAELDQDSNPGVSDSEDIVDFESCEEGDEDGVVVVAGDGGVVDSDDDDDDGDAVLARKSVVVKSADANGDKDKVDIDDNTDVDNDDEDNDNDDDGGNSETTKDSTAQNTEHVEQETSLGNEEKEEGGKDYCVEVFEVLVDQAENRLSARRAARAEARDIRMRELEKQQKEMEQKHDRIYEITSNSVAPSSRVSRRGSDDSTSSEDTRELRKQVAELEEKYKKAMMNNAQLDNEKQTYRFQVDQLKDKLEDLEEQYIEVNRLHKDRCKDLDQKKRDYKDLQLENEYYKAQLEQRDALIKEYNLVFVNNDMEDKEDKKGRRKKKKDPQAVEGTAALVTKDALEILSQHEGNLDERLKQFRDQKLELEDENRRLKQQLEEEREKKEMAEKYASPKRETSSKVNNGPTEMQLMEVQMEAQKQVNDYKFRLSKAEQDITMLEGNIVRLESQVKRYKQAAESSEKQEDELKADKRKLQRELRESLIQIEELQSTNEHLKMRMEKIRQAGRSQLAK